MITFTCKNERETIEFHTDEVELHRIVEGFERFLLAAGFAFPGHLEFQDDETEPVEEIE